MTIIPAARITVFINIRYLSIIALILVLFSPVISWSENGESNTDITQHGYRQPSKISMLANYVIGRGDDEQREFTTLTLGSMIDAYGEVLHHSSQSKPRTPKGRKKQITWGWATSRMIASLNHQLRRLEGGAPFNLQVDHLHRILIIIDGQVVEVTGPRFRSQSRFEQHVVEYFCLTRDCSWLEPKEPEKSKEEIAIARSLSNGTWSFQQNGRPAYVIGGLIYYEFTDFTDRNAKAELSHKITDEIEKLILKAKKIKDDEYPICWSCLMQLQPASVNPELELINGNSKTRLKPTLLPQLHQADRERLIKWLHYGGVEAGEKLKIKHLSYTEKTDVAS